MNFARVDVNFKKGYRDLILIYFFYFDINQHKGPTNTLYKVSAKYT